MFILYENDDTNMQSNKIRYLNETILINKWNELQKMSNEIHSRDGPNNYNFLEKDLLNKNTQFIFIDENRIIFSNKDETISPNISPSISPIASPSVSPRVSPPPLDNYNNFNNYIPFVPYDKPIKNLNKNSFDDKFSRNYVDYDKIITNKHFHIYENYMFVSFLIFLFIISSTVFFFCLTFSYDKFYSNYKIYNLSKKKRITNNNDLTKSLIVENV